MARRRGSGHGGYRTPASPAAVSGPGALSQRTDSAPPGEFSGLPYGENKAINDQMDAAPTQPGQPGQGGARSAPGGARLPQGGVFGATGRPDEPMTAGVDAGPGPGATQPVLGPDPHQNLRALAAKYPSPDLDRLIARISGV